ncbi:unnamed protein product, partial [Pylaiella littoralis]
MAAICTQGIARWSLGIGSDCRCCRHRVILEGYAAAAVTSCTLHNQQQHERDAKLKHGNSKASILVYSRETSPTMTYVYLLSWSGAASRGGRRDNGFTVRWNEKTKNDAHIVRA